MLVGLNTTFHIIYVQLNKPKLYHEKINIRVISFQIQEALPFVGLTTNFFSHSLPLLQSHI